MTVKKEYIGTKRINATPMTRSEYNTYRGWDLPENEDGNDEGYLIEYLDGGKPNHPNHAGYISWSPKDVFNLNYQCSGSMTFGHALELAQAGYKIARAGWNGKNMFVVYMPGMLLAAANSTEADIKVNARTSKFVGEDKALEVLPYYAMYTADGKWLPGWLASQSDMNAADWCVLS
jgi:hypothetical protein